MNVNRNGEKGTIPKRTDRYYQEDNAWYFYTREGSNIGPFDNQQDAERGFKDFIDFVSLADAKTLSSFYNSLSTDDTTDKKKEKPEEA